MSSINSNSGSHRTLKIVCVVLCCLLLLSAGFALFFVFKSDDVDSVSFSNLVLTSSDAKADDADDSVVFLSFDYLDSSDSNDSFVASVSFSNAYAVPSDYYWSVEVDSSYDGYSAGGERWLDYDEINYLDYFILTPSVYSCTVTCIAPFGCRFNLCYYCFDFVGNEFSDYICMDYYAYFDSVDVHIYDEDRDNGYGQFYEDLLTATFYKDGSSLLSYSNRSSSLSCDVSLYNVCFCNSLRPFVEITSYGYSLGSVLYDLGDPYLCVDLLYLDDSSLSSSLVWTLALEECSGSSFSVLTSDFFTDDAIFSIRISPFSGVVFDVLVYFTDSEWLTEDSVTYGLDFTDSSSVPDSVSSYDPGSFSDFPSALCIEKNFVYYFDYTGCGLYTSCDYFDYSLQTSTLESYECLGHENDGLYLGTDGLSGSTQIASALEDDLPGDAPWVNEIGYMTNYFMFDFARFSVLSDVSVTVYFSPMFENCTGSVFLGAYNNTWEISMGMSSFSLEGTKPGQVYSLTFTCSDFFEIYGDLWGGLRVDGERYVLSRPDDLYFMYQDPLYILGFEIVCNSPFVGFTSTSNMDWGETYPSIGSVSESIFVLDIDFSNTSSFNAIPWGNDNVDSFDRISLDDYGIVYFADHYYVSEISSGYLDVCDPQYDYSGVNGRASSDSYMYFDFSDYVGYKVTISLSLSSRPTTVYIDDEGVPCWDSALSYAGLVTSDMFSLFCSSSSFDFSSCLASGSGTFNWFLDYTGYDEETGEAGQWIGHYEPGFTLSYTFTPSSDFYDLYLVWSDYLCVWDIEISIF